MYSTCTEHLTYFLLMMWSLIGLGGDAQNEIAVRDQFQEIPCGPVSEEVPL